MSKVIVVHSFRRAAGKSSLAANLAALFASQGKRVGAFDTDFQAPSLHLFFNLPETEIACTLNSYLLGTCEVEQAAYDVSQRLGLAQRGALFAFPASSSASDILQMLRSPFECDRMNQFLVKAGAAFDLDTLIIDTNSGLNEDTLTSLALADTLLLLLRPVQQDYQGTAVTVEVARSLGITDLQLLMNEIPETLDPEQAAHELQRTYHAPVAALLPYSPTLAALGSRKPIVLENPDDPYSAAVRQIAARLEAE